MEQKIEDILNTYGNLLYRTAMVILGNPQDVQDVLQDVLIKCMKKMPDFDDKEHEKAWLLRVTINLCKDMLRFRSRHQYLDIETVVIESEEVQEYDLLQEIALLPYKWRIVLILHFVEGYSLKEIAGILSISENAVKKRMQRAKTALKKRLEDN
ncbi:MAG: RNA polymerase sigma factor [Roseburia sp.]|nr:RNA polymerase sigma factor [Roseburia sp.]MCM1243562.1 RNA polymerase sigma factor [Roseburia sp.]